MERILSKAAALLNRVPEPYRRHIPAAALVLGFLWDLVTLGRPDQLYGNILILTHFVLAGGSILLLNIRKARGEEKVTLPLTALMQFSFGSLASALLLFYGQSGTLTENWLFLALFVAFLVGNELARSRYALIVFHIGVLYLLLFAYFGLIVPIALDRMGTYIFLLSGILSVALMVAFLALLYRKAPQLIRSRFLSVGATVASIFIAMNALYFLNLIPPVPLALRSIDLYHQVTRVQSGEYHVLREQDPNGSFFRRLITFAPPTLHFAPGQSVYCFTSIFAPAGLSVPVRHRWEFYDATREIWETEALISFPIRGGRDEGYRGFTIKRLTREGLWRCDVETDNGVLIGRSSFTVRFGTASELVQEIR